MPRPTCYALALVLAAFLPTPASAQSDGGADLAAFWTGSPKWLRGSMQGGEAFEGGVRRARFSYGVVNSSVGPEGDVPVLLRFDSTETSVVGRTLFGGCTPFDAVGTFRGSAWDLSDPAAPRRLNLLLIEHAGSAQPIGRWDPGDYLIVMASTYDGTGTSYATGCRTDPLDAVYYIRLYLEEGRLPYESSPAGIRIERAFIRSLTAAPTNGAVALTWAYDRPGGAAFRLYRRSTDKGPGTLLTTLPISARSFDESGLSLDSTYTYRLEAVGGGGEVLHVSAEAAARPYVSRNMTLVGSLNPREIYADVWGYVGPGGREYALLNAAFGLSVIDVTGGQPVEVGFVPGPGSASDVEASGSYAYVSSNGAPTQIVDLTDPTNPVLRGTFGANVHTLTVADGYLYTQGGAGPRGVLIYSLADPLHPALVGEYQPHYIHDILVRGDTMYAAGIYGQGVDIVDISDRASPVLIHRFNYPNSGAHNFCTTENGSFLFVGDEIGAGRWTRVYDVRDPRDPELVAEIIVDPTSTVHNCYVRGDLLFLAHYAEGVRVWDVSDPRAPTEVAFYDTHPSPLPFGGAWTAYPHLPSGRIIVSDMDFGLFVLRLDEGVPTEPTAVSSPTLTLRASPNPMRGGGHITFSSPESSDVRLTLYDLLGREVAVLAEGPVVAGTHSARVDVGALPPGVYLLRLTSAGRGTGARLTVVR